jgi:hypothetical protein
MAPRFTSSFASRRRSFALSKDRASLKHSPRFTDFEIADDLGIKVSRKTENEKIAAKQDIMLQSKKET